MKLTVRENHIAQAELLGGPQIIMENPTGKHNYFAWPTVAKLQNGKLMAVASGYRIKHVCPFGKMVMSISENEGKTWTMPAPVIDTPLDDRDGGICTFGESGVIVTSFNNAAKAQRDFIQYATEHHDKELIYVNYRHEYLNLITPEDEEKYLGITFRVSYDCGVTFGEIHKSPVSSPHGPVQLSDGTILWVGRTGGAAGENKDVPEGYIAAYRMNPEDWSMEYVGCIEPIIRQEGEMVSCEPYALELPNGEIICHIRVQWEGEGYRNVFTTYQSKSADGGKTWTKPVQVLTDDQGGAPAHLMLHSSGVLISTYGCRYEQPPHGIRVMFSVDNGESWDTEHIIYENNISSDLGYPSTIELSDGSLLTVFYAHEAEDSPAVIYQQRWKLKK